MQKPHLAEKSTCTGCYACASVCAKGAITMEEEGDGFLYPHVQMDHCVLCGACTNICPVLSAVPSEVRVPLSCYGCAPKEADYAHESTSGGLFYALASRWLKRGGIVYGAALTEDMLVHHQAATSLFELAPLRKSKYVQSALDGIFPAIRRFLAHGTPVLFCGTPCQCAGLSAYLGKRKDGEEPKKSGLNIVRPRGELLIVELFCGQVTGRKTWRKYLKEQSEAVGSDVTYAEFRSKLVPCAENEAPYGVISGGWKDPYVALMFSDGTKRATRWTADLWTKAYVASLMQRMSCDRCPFKEERGFTGADIAIGDFWGAENNAPEVYSRMGTSAAVAYTEVGVSYLESVGDILNLRDVPITAVRKGNPDVWAPHPPHPKRTEFLDALDKPTVRFGDAVNVCLGLHRNVSTALRVGVWGGFDLRQAVISACSAGAASMEYHISNICLTSAYARAVAPKQAIEYPRNPIRAAMLRLDLQKHLFGGETGARLSDVDYLVIDLMEERYGIAAVDNAWLTNSDALCDSSAQAQAVISPMDVDESLWSHAYHAFVTDIQRILPNSRVVLVHSMLSPLHQTDDDGMRPFSDQAIGMSVAALNSVLRQRYDYLAQSMDGVHHIMPPEELWFCEAHHKHGVVPSHTNMASRDFIRAQLETILWEEELS